MKKHKFIVQCVETGVTYKFTTLKMLCAVLGCRHD